MAKSIAQWLHYFEQNRAADHTIAWDKARLDTPGQQQAVARSLAHFALGESGEGQRIRRLSAQLSAQRAEPGYGQAVALFVKEENRHAELLAQGVLHLQGTMVDTHWTETVFVALRRLLSLAVEVQILAIAEIIGLSFYSMIRQRTKDMSLAAMCDIFLREETEHLNFDADSIVWIDQGRPHALFRLGTHAVFWGAITAAWIDHRPALHSLGFDFRSWVRKNSQVYQQFIARRDL